VGKAAEDGEGFGAVVGAVSCGVLVEGDIEGPVLADGFGEGLGREAAGGEVVARRGGPSSRVAVAEARQARPGMSGLPGSALSPKSQSVEGVTLWQRVSMRPWSASVVVNAARGSGGSVKNRSTSASIARRFAFSAKR
jgi:hypothetical protein